MSENKSSHSSGTSFFGLPVETIIRRTLNYWPLFLLALLLAAISSTLYLRYTPKVHKVQARLVISDDEQGQSTNLLRFKFDGSGNYNQVEKEVEILRSRSLLSEVVKRLSLQVQFKQEGKVITTPLYGDKSPLQLTLYEPEKVAKFAEGPVQVGANKTIKFGEEEYPIDSLVNSPFGLIRWTLNEPVKPEDRIFLQLYTLPQAVSKVRGSLTVAPITKESSIIDVSILETIPTRGVEIINTLLDVYNTNYVNFKRRIAQNTIDFVDGRLNLLASELSAIEENLEKFKSQSGVIDLSYEGQLFLNQVSEFDKSISQIDVQLKILNDLKGYVTRRNVQDAPAPATLGLTDPLLLSLLNQLFTAEFEYNKLKTLSGPKNPQLIALEEQVNTLRPSILESITNLERALVNSRNRLQSSNRTAESALRGIPVKERKLLDISRQQTIKNSIYTYLLERREEAAIKSASVVPSNRIIDNPEVMGLEKPKSMLAYMLSLLFFFGAALLIVFMKEFANPRFLYKNEIEESLGIPVVGQIELVPDEERSGGIIQHENGRSMINEQFRELRTNISFLNKSEQSQSILFTSSKSGEGKSFVSTNLSISLAKAGKSVVLLEMDLRKPKIQQYLGLDKSVGLTTYLIEYATLESIIRTVPGIDGLHVIGSGPLPPNPAEILLSPKVDELFAYLKQNFDYIIIDAPPVGIVSDARLLGKYADLCLYIIRYNYTDRNFADFINDMKSKKGLPSMNAVFNAIPIKRMQYYGYGYGYGYGYMENRKSPSIWKRIKSLFGK
ncbi:MAG TPA: polysaccharide biosynthesis tyrosine autokinase [Parasegetibacter sp.]|jgi:tyrosine-protein kinase Etk/Wzc